MAEFFDFTELYNNPHRSDLTITFSGQTFYAYKIIISSVVNFFKPAVTAKWLTKDAVHLGCEDAAEVERMMKRCYGIREPVPHYGKLMEAIKAADIAAWYLVDEQYIAEAASQIAPLCHLTDQSTEDEKSVVVEDLWHIANITTGRGFEALDGLLTEAILQNIDHLMGNGLFKEFLKNFPSITMVLLCRKVEADKQKDHLA